MSQTYEDRPTLERWNELVATVGSMPKIAAGSYRGDNTYGEDHPTTLTFDFTPKLVFMFAYHTESSLYNAAGYVPSILCWGLTGKLYHGVNNTSSPATVSYSGNTLSIVSTANAANQLNNSYNSYYWVAIG